MRTKARAVFIYAEPGAITETYVIAKNKSGKGPKSATKTFQMPGA